MAHAFLGCLIRGFQRMGFPEAEGTMLLERGHVAQQAFIKEMRKTPFDGLLDIRAGCMKLLAQGEEDRLGERGGLRDIGINARIGFRHAGWLRILASGGGKAWKTDFHARQANVPMAE